MVHMHYFELCFTKSRGFAGVRLWLGAYHHPYSLYCLEGLFPETRTARSYRPSQGREVLPPPHRTGSERRNLA